jgi:hypothetical protein
MRNSKQIQITEAKTSHMEGKGVGPFRHLNFGLVSDSVIRISNLPRIPIKNHAVYRQTKQSAEITP